MVDDQDLEPDADAEAAGDLNVLGSALQVCGTDPMTGFFRDGRCGTGPDDIGSHTVCAAVTASFLRYTAALGNDLSTPRPDLSFPGLQPGDRWCLCVGRWAEALRAGVAPPVVLEATHEAALKHVSLADLRTHAAET